MNCIKCGREIPEEQVFCEECLAVMDRYPVKPGTPVRIPDEAYHTTQKKGQRKGKSMEPEDVIARQNNAIRKLLLVVLAVLLCWSATLIMLIHVTVESGKTPIGQNYNITATTGTDTGT